MASPELLTLVKCREQLSLVIRNNLEAIASFLNIEDVISHKVYREVTNTQSGHSDDERATTIFRGLEDKVEEDDKFYSKFYKYLRSHKHYSKITSQMNKEIVQLRRKRSKWSCNMNFFRVTDYII